MAFHETGGKGNQKQVLIVQRKDQTEKMTLTWSSEATLALIFGAKKIEHFEANSCIFFLLRKVLSSFILETGV